MTAPNTFQLFGLRLRLSRVPFLLSTFCFLLSLCSPLLASDPSSPVVRSPVVSSPGVSGPTSRPNSQPSTLNPQLPERPQLPAASAVRNMDSLDDKQKLGVGDR